MPGSKPGPKANPEREAFFRRFFRRFVSLTIVSSLIPLLVVGWAFHFYYTDFAKRRVEDSFATQLEQHRELVEMFLQEQVDKLQLIAQINTRAFLADEANLQRAFRTINETRNAFTDLGLISEEGNHLAYVGPFDLLDRNYSQSFWFQEIIGGDDKHTYVSDMFLGFREVPHFIIAVLRNEGSQRWILRATIDTDAFRRIVEDVRIGTTGDVFLLNRAGVYQSNPSRGGQILQESHFPVQPFSTSVQVKVERFGVEGDGEGAPVQIAAFVWLSNPEWMLVMRQHYSEALYDVNHVTYVTLVVLHISALIILVVIVLATRYMISVMRKQDRALDDANARFAQASKLASVGELSAGVAHEINNPLAIILSENQILADMETQTAEMDPQFREQLLTSMERIKSQIQRCKRLTHSLLRFSRQTESPTTTVNVNSVAREVVELVERDAATRGIRIILDLETELPSVLADASQVQQVFLNLLTNAVDAHEGRSYGSVRITTRANRKERGVDIVVADTGVGIPAAIMDKVFDPFFTTKPVGRGTGLGLSICFGIVSKFGGRMSVESEEGEGTTFRIFLPFEPAPSSVHIS